MSAATAPLIPASKRPLTVISEQVVTDPTAKTVNILYFFHTKLFNFLFFQLNFKEID